MRRKVELERSQAAELLEHISGAIALGVDNGQRMNAVYELLRRYKLLSELCPGEAHKNPHIDHCSQCAPHWGTVTPEVKVR